MFEDFITLKHSVCPRYAAGGSYCLLFLVAEPSEGERGAVGLVDGDISPSDKKTPKDIKITLQLETY